ncbi:hypothetical protein CVT25_004885 [Psilocybe cyanescens]|uniref:N-acetyltransferase domain-containing protein n=1 Tax=Psilocybe cyanescens TaxID=93625 RepID=A0A409XBG8_PSICY|nr:hypothetical protein CVT25_004885 [Psilocybe cyanescens]
MDSGMIQGNSTLAGAGTSICDPITAGSGRIYIRPYRSSDSEQVRELFRSSFGTGRGSLLRSAMRGQLADRISIALYTMGTLSLCFQAISLPSNSSNTITYLGQATLFAAVATFLNRAYGLYAAMMKFINLGLNGDMLDISKHYGGSDLLLDGSASDSTKDKEKNGYWVAELREKDGTSLIVGGTGIDVTTRNEPSSAELRRMIVSPICRRRGVGAQLIRVSLDHAQKHGIKSVYITTSIYQTSALTLYEKFGWVRQTQREKHCVPVHIRPFRPSDFEQVHNDSLWRRAMRAQYRAPLSFFSYSLIICGLLMFTRQTENLPASRTGILIAVAGAFLFSLHRLLLEFGLKRIVRQNLECDLKDIARHYNLIKTTSGEHEYIPYGKSGFWVAEIEGEEHKSEIVGTVGLDSSTSEDPTSSELRRMVVSRHCRRKGVACQLIKTLLAHARAHATKSIFLSTSFYQDEAITMYKAFGWRFQRKQDVSFLSQPIYMFHFNIDVDDCRL